MKSFLNSAALIICFSMLLSFSLSVNFAWAQSGQTSSTQKPSSKKDNDERLVSIDFNDVDISVFIKFISELTGKNFVVDDRVKGKVTIISPSKISVDEAFKVFESVLEVHGYAAVKAGEIIKIISAPDARTKNITTRLKAEAGSPEDKVVTQIIPLAYADPNEIKKLFTPLISKNSVLLAYTPTNMLILTDVYSNIQRLLSILKVIDVTDIGRQLTVLPIDHADAVKLVKMLESVFETKKKPAKGATQTTIKMVADERTNIIILMASEADTQRIKDLIAMIDKEAPKGTEKVRVYYLEHAKAEDLATALQSLSKKPSAKGAKEPIVSEKVSITADKPTNSLIIMAEKDEYQVLEEIIKKLDIPRAMVYIECLIMEVNVNKDFNLGVEWTAGNEFDSNEGAFTGGFSGGASDGDSGLLPSPLPPGFSMGVFHDTIDITLGTTAFQFPSIGAIVYAYKKDRDVHILSTPQILTTDNEEASIHVGKNIPFKTKSGTEVDDTNIFYETFEYKDVGITLKITPQISKDRMVRLTISQEVSRIEATNEFRPTTLKRTLDTTVIVDDKNTVVIGGLIDDSFSNIEYKTPCLGEIPGFRKLFTSESEGAEKTNLYIFLTPYVIQNPEEAEQVYKKKDEHINTIKEGNIKLYKRSKEEPSDKKTEAIDLTR